MDRATATEHLTDYLTGYGHHDRQRLTEVANYPDWKTRAKAELDRRMTQLIETLPSELVTAIATGEVDMGEVAEQLLKEGN
jgi:hypothetical protein